MSNYKRGQLILLGNELIPEIRHNEWAYVDCLDRTSGTYKLVKPKNMRSVGGLFCMPVKFAFCDLIAETCFLFLKRLLQYKFVKEVVQELEEKGGTV